MAKMKTHRGSKKRIKVTGTGKLMKKRAFGGHLLTKKTAGRKRKIRKVQSVDASNVATLRDLLGI
ncbi:MAG: 50S ribosomal protein L35 [Thermoleophilia bacterium]